MKGFDHKIGRKDEKKSVLNVFKGVRAFIIRCVGRDERYRIGVQRSFPLEIKTEAESKCSGLLVRGCRNTGENKLN